MNAQSKLHITLQTETAGALRWEVLSHLELPGGAIAWLRVSPIANDLTTALLSSSSKALVIEETGVVAKLKVNNPLDVDVLLPTDLIVDGGKQARVVERSVILAPQSSAEVGVRCVEQGRWAARDASTANRFAVNAPANVSSRSHLAKLKKQSYTLNKQYELDQGAVWTHVQHELHRTKTTSTTQSYVAFMDQSQNAARLREARRLDIEPPEHANAIALVHVHRSLPEHDGPSDGVWLEIFPSRAAMLPIVPNVVADALEPPQRGVPSPSNPRTRANDAMKLVATSALTPISRLESTLGDSFGFEADTVAGQALLLGGRLAHVVASVSA